MKVKNGFKYKKNGWTYISIKGEPYERGLAHGTLLKEEIKKCLTTMEWNLYDSHGLKFPRIFQRIKGNCNRSQSRFRGINLME